MIFRNHYSFLHTFKIHSTKLSKPHLSPFDICPTHAYIRNILLLHLMFPLTYLPITDYQKPAIYTSLYKEHITEILC